MLTRSREAREGMPNISEAVINPGRQKGEPRLPPYGLLLPNPAETAFAATLACQHQGRRHFLFNSNLYLLPAADRRQPFFVVGPAVGAPMAAMTLEKLIALGGRGFIVYGWCGAMHSSLKIGDVLLPTWGVSEEGTSRHYPIQDRPASTEKLQVELALTLQHAGINSVSAPLWTTDAPYRETWDKVQSYAEQGVLAVDMEFTALATVAAYRGVELAAVMLVSDELWRQPWRPGFGTRGFKDKSRAILQTLFALCGQIPR